MSWAERNPTVGPRVPIEFTRAAVVLVGAADSYINGADLVVEGGGIALQRV